MLTLAMRIGNDAATLKHALPGLTGLAGETRQVLFLDQGSQDASREMLQAFIRRSGGALLALEGPVSAPEAAALARRQTGADYVLIFTPQDRINRAGLAALERRLAETRPDLVILASAFWLIGADCPLPGPDAARGTERPRTLFPDPRRLVIRGGACAHPDPFTDPAAAWDVWRTVLDNRGQALLPPDPVLLRALPETGAAPAFEAATGWVMDAPKPARAERLEEALLWTGDALSLAPAHSATETLSAAARLLAALPRALRRRIPDLAGSAAQVLAALARKDTAAALALLALLAQSRAELRTRALADSYAALRHDLDLALPGPDYLMELYARLRGV